MKLILSGADGWIAVEFGPAFQRDLIDVVKTGKAKCRTCGLTIKPPVTYRFLSEIVLASRRVIYYLLCNTCMGKVGTFLQVMNSEAGKKTKASTG